MRNRIDYWYFTCLVLRQEDLAVAREAKQLIDKLGLADVVYRDLLERLGTVDNKAMRRLIRGLGPISLRRRRRSNTSSLEYERSGAYPVDEADWRGQMIE